MQIQPAPDIQNRIDKIVRTLELSHIISQNLHCFRSFNATARARARIWGLPRIWQSALDIPTHYCIEVLSQHFDHLSHAEQDKILIHELLHIPKNFSGALVPHRSRVHGRKTYRHYHQEVDALYARYISNLNN